MRAAVIVLDDSWTTPEVPRVAGLSLLGRALLALADSGVTTIAVVGADAATLGQAIGARCPPCRLVPCPAALAPRDVLACARIAAGDRVTVVGQPIVVDRETCARLVGVPGPMRLEGAPGVMTLDAASIAAEATWSAALELGARAPAVSPSRRALVSAPRTRVELVAVERELLLTTAKSVDVDGVVAFHLVRPVSRFLSRHLSRTGVTPNVVSAAALGLGVVAAGLAAVGTIASEVGAAALLFAGVLLDCVDGELARVRHLRSRLGEWLDSLADDVSTGAYALGLGLGLGPWPFALPLGPRVVGVATAALFALTTAYIYWFLAKAGGAIDTTQFPYFARAQAPSGRPASPWLRIARFALKRDFFVGMFVVLACCRVTWVSLLLLALGTLGNAAAVIVTALSGLWAPAPVEGRHVPGHAGLRARP